MAKILTQPTDDEQLELQSLITDEPTEVAVRNKTYKLKWLKNGTRQKITREILKKGGDDTAHVKCAVLMVLNGYWKIKLRFWFMWRWWYYVRQYNENELMELLAVGSKKKVPQMQYYTNTMLLLGLRDTSETMKKTEVPHSLLEHPTEQAGN
jgi:hypothetical protein